MQNLTIAATATPPGKGGIAVIRISGPEAFSIAAKIFKPKDTKKSILEAKGYTALFGHFMQKGKVCDEVLALCFRAPKSYTGEDVVEISCHGGSAVSGALLRACYSAGAQVAEPGEFTRRAFLNGRISLTQAEGILDMINATSRQGVNAAAVLMEGALHKKIIGVRTNLTELASHIAAFSDYPEEDVPELENTALLNYLNTAINDLSQLLHNYNAGKIFRSGIRASIVGSPNVGKSTLLNTMAGFERAIVTPIAGTTRDVIEQEINLDDVNLILCDTAGLRQTSDIAEAEGIRRSKLQMERADLVIAVFDGSKKVTKDDEELAQLCKDKPSVAIINKADLTQLFEKEAIENYFNFIVQVSANDDKFLPLIKEAVMGALNVADINPDACLIANERQFDLANKAHEALLQASDALSGGFTLDAVGVCVDDALNVLFELTGENATQTVIDEVFSRFCVGK